MEINFKIGGEVATDTTVMTVRVGMRWAARSSKAGPARGTGQESEEEEEVGKGGGGEGRPQVRRGRGRRCRLCKGSLSGQAAVARCARRSPLAAVLMPVTVT